MDLVSELRKVKDFEDLPEDRFQWLVDHSELKKFQAGDQIFKAGNPIDELIIVLSGKCMVKIMQDNQFRALGAVGPYAITGLLPYSRAKVAKGYGEITEETAALFLHRDHFRYMVTHFEDLTAALVHVMSSRIREFTRSQQQNEKMLSLGKLSAGLAHELNNPSAAVVRSAQMLKKHLASLPDKFKKALKIKLTDEEIDDINGILFSKISQGVQDIPMLEKSDKEDDFVDWMDQFDVEESEEVAENLIDFGFELEDLDQVKEQAEEKDVSPILNWMNQVLTTEKLVSEIEEASTRINDLVGSIKSYSHMDQAPEMVSADIHDGINNTLVMLGHKLRKNQIELVKKYDQRLGNVSIIPSMMNQVWTNIIDNAVDAMKDANTRKLEIETKQDGSFVNIYLRDSGSGIPEEIQTKIFDPFFTTKKIGEGAGLGLEIVSNIITKDHKGSIKVKSEPGKTEFEICFPISQN